MYVCVYLNRYSKHKALGMECMTVVYMALCRRVLNIGVMHAKSPLRIRKNVPETLGAEDKETCTSQQLRAASCYF